MNKVNEKSEYDTQAETFLQKHGIAFSARFLYHGPHWEGDKDNRNVWSLTLSKGTGRNEQLEVKFGQSIADSFLWPQKDGYGLCRYNDKRMDHNSHIQAKYKTPRQHMTPSPYDMLACITKYDPGSFEEFCSEFGYDTDSRKAEATWRAVQEEWTKVKRFFTEAQLDEIREIN